MFHLYPHTGVFRIPIISESEINKKMSFITILTKFNELEKSTYYMTIYQLSKRMLQLHLKFIVIQVFFFFNVFT